MLITRTETYTDWVYQGALAGETAAWNGVGLYEGSIYFRHSHDALKPGERILREEFFVELSDGSTYPLGEGASGEKVTILNHGTTSDGSVYLEVKGNPDYGVGVYRVTQNITVEFDDGRVPVLDTEQLDEVLSQLNDSLTTSMKDTADAVRRELREELRTGVEDSKQDCNMRTEAVKNELTTSLDSLRSTHESDKLEVLRQVSTVNSQLLNTTDELNGKIATVEGKLSSIESDIENSVKETNQFNIALWKPTKSIAVNSGLNLKIIDHDTQIVQSDNVFTHGMDGSVILKPSMYDRVLTLTFTSSVNLADKSHKGYWYFFIADDKEALVAQSVFPIMPDDVANFYITQQSVRMFIPRGADTHPAVSGGVFPRIRNMYKDTLTFSRMELELTLQTSFKLQNDPILP